MKLSECTLKELMNGVMFAFYLRYLHLEGVAVATHHRGKMKICLGFGTAYPHIVSIFTFYFIYFRFCLTQNP